MAVSNIKRWSPLVLIFVVLIHGRTKDIGGVVSKIVYLELADLRNAHCQTTQYKSSIDGAMTFSITTFSIRTLSIMGLFVTLSIIDTTQITLSINSITALRWVSLCWVTCLIYCYAECHYTEWSYCWMTLCWMSLCWVLLCWMPWRCRDYPLFWQAKSVGFRCHQWTDNKNPLVLELNQASAVYILLVCDHMI